MIVFIQRIVHNPRRNQQMGLQMVVFFRRQFVSPAVSKWQSLSAEDSLLTFSQQGLQMAVFFRRQFVSPAVSKWQSLSAEDSLLIFIQQGLQMAVSPNRRQFVPLAIGKWQSFPKKRQFVY